VDGCLASRVREAAVLVDQYNQFSPVAGMHVNGALTLPTTKTDRRAGLCTAHNLLKLAEAKA
jgi:hypothetical protein